MVVVKKNNSVISLTTRNPHGKYSSAAARGSSCLILFCTLITKSSNLKIPPPLVLKLTIKSFCSFECLAKSELTFPQDVLQSFCLLQRSMA